MSSICFGFRSTFQRSKNTLTFLNERYRSDYESSPAFVKLLVNGLTEIFKVFVVKDKEEVDNSITHSAAPMDPELLLQ
eukprot:gene36898-48135_t